MGQITRSLPPSATAMGAIFKAGSSSPATLARHTSTVRKWAEALERRKKAVISLWPRCTELRPIRLNVLPPGCGCSLNQNRIVRRGSDFSPLRRQPMQNEHPFGGQPPLEAPRGQSGPSASHEWSEFQRELEILGRQLSELRAHTAALDDHLVRGLEAQYHEVKARADAWKRATEQQVDEAQWAYSDLRTRSREAARQMWERSEPLRQGARDVGEGLVSAWAELRASFGKAAGRLSSETPPSTSIRPADERRDS